MADTNQSLDSVSGENQLDSSEGNSQNDVVNTNSTSETLTLEDIQTLTGRKYDSLEKAKIGLQETYKYVGQKQAQVSSSEMYGYTAQELFTMKHPDAVDKKDKIFMYAKATKQTPEQAYSELFGSITREQSLQNSPVDSINRSSDNRITPQVKSTNLNENLTVEQLKRMVIDNQSKMGDRFSASSH